MTPTEAEARRIIEQVYAAWNAGDIDRMLTFFCDDLVYHSNTGGFDGEPITIHDKGPFRELYSSVLVAAESSVAVTNFQFDQGIARTQQTAITRHRTTGHELVGSYRQLTEFRDGKISKVEQFHDAARMAAFWRLIQMEIVTPLKPRQPSDEVG